MNYCNANDILPNELVNELRKYISNGFLYIPLTTPRKSWGSLSGQKKELATRNRFIVDAYHNGKTIDELATELFLSKSTIYRILRISEN